MVIFGERSKEMNEKVKQIGVCGLVISFLIFVNTGIADLLHVGTYEYSQAPDSFGDAGNAGPIVYDSSSIQGDGDTSRTKTALWSSNDNLGSDGITITFDLENLYYISSVKTLQRVDAWWGIGPVDFYYSVDGQNYTFVGTDGEYFHTTEWIDDRIKERSMNYNDVQARYIKLQVHSCQPAPGESSNWHLPLSEVEIYGSAVPEPTSIGLVLLGLVGLFRRR